MSIYNDYQTVSTTVTDVKAINNSIRNILLTPIGSLPGRPDFGSRINNLLFEQNDAAIKDLVDDYVIEALTKWEPRITITDIRTVNDPKYNTLYIYIYFYYVNNGIIVNDKIDIGFSI